MADQVYIAVEDFDGDLQKSSFSVADVADRADFPTWDGEMTTLRTQLIAWTLGRVRTQGYNIVTNQQDPGAASSPAAQGSLQAIIEMRDSVTAGIYTERLPIPDVNKADDVGANPAWIADGKLTIANPVHAGYVTLKAAMEASWESPNGNTGSMVRMYIEE